MTMRAARSAVEIRELAKELGFSVAEIPVEDEMLELFRVHLPVGVRGLTNAEIRGALMAIAPSSIIQGSSLGDKGV
jgi:hypothetical protein